MRIYTTLCKGINGVLVGAIVALFAQIAVANAEVGEVRFARQLGIGYLQFYIMEALRLVEKHASAAGITVTSTYIPLSSPTALSDALLSKNVDVVGIGLPGFLTMWDRTRSEIKGIVALNRQPAYLLTRKPDVKSLRDYSEGDRIALPAPKVSVQAIMLQMVAERQLGVGHHSDLDHLTVGMSHPDGTTAMLVGRSEVTSHFTSAPFQYQQLEASKDIRKVLTSYDATGGPNTFSVAITTESWKRENPRTYRAIVAALAEANGLITSEPKRAAELFRRTDNVKLPLEFLERMIRDPEFSFDPSPMNVVAIQHFMQRVGSLKTKAGSWTDLFHAEAHHLGGS